VRTFTRVIWVCLGITYCQDDDFHRLMTNEPDAGQLCSSAAIGYLHIPAPTDGKSG
jgi:hypothetical protein